MATSIIKTVKTAINYWWVSLLSGIFFVIVGIWVFKTPLESYLALAILFSVAFFVSGIFEITYAVSNRSQLEGWGWALTGGIIDLILGFILMSNPAITLPKILKI